MMYGESDAAPALGLPSGPASSPRSGVRLQGLERRRGLGLERDPVRHHRAAGPSLRDDRPGGVLRLPGDATQGQAGRRSHPGGRVAGGGAVRGPRAASAPRPRAAHRPRAVVSLAHLLRHRRRAGRGAGRPARGHARRAARRRAAHAAGVGQRRQLRRWAGGAAGPADLVLRGADRHRRRPARRLPAGRDPLGEPLGGGAALHRRDAQPQGGAGAGAQA